MSRNTLPQRNLPDRSPKRHLLWITGAVLCATGPLLAIGGLISGAAGCVTVLAALAICLVGNLVSSAVAHRFRAPSQVLYQVLIGFMLRMGIPLFACMLAYLRVGMLAESGFVYYIMTFYFVALTVETVLLASGNRKRPHQSKTG